MALSKNGHNGQRKACLLPRSAKHIPWSIPRGSKHDPEFS
jgi:hypothetical protein